MNIKFCYLYRDGSNYKNFNEIVFSNPNSKNFREIEKLVREKLIDDKWFYCKEWNVPDIHFKEFAYDPAIDVDWHEFETIEETTEKVSGKNSIEDLLMLISMTKPHW
jgi:hypothetical protein